MFLYPAGLIKNARLGSVFKTLHNIYTMNLVMKRVVELLMIEDSVI